jgi:hypothetical protein
MERAAHLFDRFGLSPLPTYRGTIQIGKDEDDPETISLKRFILACDWFQIYDLVEDIFSQLDFYEDELGAHFDEAPRAYPLQQTINAFFIEAGIGWKMEGGKITARGSDTFELSFATATKELDAANRETASKHLRDAMHGLSRRPEPDLTGAIFHAMAAMESISRDLTGSNRTLGEILKRHPGLIPPPLDEAMRKVWGFASENARHGAEGRNPEREEAELIVALVSAVISYLSKKKWGKPYDVRLVSFRAMKEPAHLALHPFG